MTLVPHSLLFSSVICGISVTYNSWFGDCDYHVCLCISACKAGETNLSCVGGGFLKGHFLFIILLGFSLSSCLVIGVYCLVFIEIV